MPKQKAKRKDIMKPQPMDYSQQAKPEGGMAHRAPGSNEEVGKLPPLPRSEFMKKPRGGMTLTNG